MTTVWPTSNFPTVLDTFTPSLVDGVDFVIANHPNSLASAIVALENKIGISNTPITGLGGVSFYPTGKSANPGGAGVPTLWVDNSGGPGFILKYTDDAGATYALTGSGLGNLQYAYTLSDGIGADPSIDIGNSYLKLGSDTYAPGEYENLEYQDIALYDSITSYTDAAHNTVIYGQFYYRNNNGTLTKHRVADNTLFDSAVVTPVSGGIAAIDGKIFIANDADNTVYVYDADDLSAVTSFSYSGGGSGIAVDSTYVYVSTGSVGVHGFEVYTHAGVSSGSGSQSTASVSGDYLAVDSSYVYLTNDVLDVVERYSTTGYGYVGLVSVTDVSGVAAVGDGTILVSSGANDEVYKYDGSLSLADTYSATEAGALTFAGTHLCVDNYSSNVVYAYSFFGLKRTFENALTKLNGKVVELQDGSMTFPVYPSDILQNRKNLEEIEASYVISFNSRTGVVVPASGDYLASQVTNAFDFLTHDSDDVSEGSVHLFMTTTERTNLADAFLKSTDDSDDITEGSVNLLMTTTERTNLADAFLKSTDDSDDITEGSVNLLMTTTERTNLADAFLKSTDNATDIDLQVIDGSGLDSVQDWMNVVQGTCILNPIPTISDNGDGTVDIGSGGIAIVKTSSSDGSPTGFIAVPATSSVALTDNSINFVYVCYNGGSPQVQVSTTPVSTDRTCAGIQIIYREGTTLHIADYGGDGYSLLNLLNQREADIALGKGSRATYAYGAIAGDTGARYVTLSAGKFYASLRPDTSPAFDTSGADDFTEYYGSTGSGWSSSTQTQVNNSQYNNGTSLVALTVNRYSTRWLYIDYNLDHISLVIGPGNYASISDALDEDAPTDLPTYLTQFGILVGQYVVQQGSNTMIVRSPFTSRLSVGSVTSHASLSNIEGPGNKHYDNEPTIGNVGIQIDQTEITGSIDSFEIENRDLTSVKTSVITDEGSIRSMYVDDNYIFTDDNNDYVTRYDRHTLEQLEQYSDSTAWGGRQLEGVGNKLVLINVNQITEFNKKDLTDYVDVTATNIAGSPTVGRGVHPISGDVYNIRGADNYLQVAVRGTSSYTVTSYALTGLAGDIKTFGFDNTGDYFYIAELDGTDVYVREYDTATRTLQQSSSAVTGTLGTISSICAKTDVISVIISGKMYLLNRSDLSWVYTTGTTTITDDSGYCFGGLFYGGDSALLSVYQLPALTTVTSDFVESHGEGTKSSSSVLDDNGDPYLVTKADEIRSVIKDSALWRDRLGVDVLSVETSLPGSPVDGGLYLISGGTSTYESSVAEYNSGLGWTIHSPSNRSKLYDLDGEVFYQWFVDRWVKKIDLVLYATVTGDGASGTVTDIMTLDVGDTTYPLLAADEFWDVDIEITGTVLNDETLSSGSLGKWYLKAGIQQAHGAGHNPSINNVVGAASPTAVGTPYTDYDTPSITLVNVSSTGDLRITVSITSASTYDFEFTARINGISRLGTSITVV